MNRLWLSFVSIFAMSLIVFVFFILRLRPIELPKPDDGSTVASPTNPTVTFVNPSYCASDAKVTIIVFSDFECAACKTLATSLEAAAKTYPNSVRVVWKNLPNESLHKMATPSAIAAHCADQQKKFWEYHDALFARQNALSETQFTLIANELDLDAKKFQSCYEERDTLPIVKKDYEEGLALGLTSTPTIFINEKMMVGSIELQDLFDAIELKL